MDIENKKTVLDDGASIYQKRKNEYTKDDIKALSIKEKLSYFKEYYLKITIIGVIISIAAGILIKDIFFDHSASIIYVGCVNQCRIDDTDNLAKDLKDYIKPENDKDFATVVNYDLDNAQFNMSFVTLVNSGTMNLVVCPYDYFVDAAGAGTFANLEDYLPDELYSSISGKILETGLTERDVDGNVLKTYEPQPFGIDLSDSAYFSECAEASEKVVLCVVNTTLNSENTLKSIEFLTK